MMVIVDELKKKKKEKRCLCSDSNLGLRRYEADVYPNAPFGHGRSSLDFERGAWTHKIRQESRAPLRLTTTMAGREACFVRNRMAKGQSQSRCDQMSKLRASQSESTPNQSPNSDDNQGITLKQKLRFQPSSSLDGGERDFYTVPPLYSRYSTGTWLPVLGPAVDYAVLPGVAALDAATMPVATVRLRRRGGPVRSAFHACELLWSGTGTRARRHRLEAVAAQRNFAPAANLRRR